MSLCLLLANDLYLKGQFHGWISGKLSDFCGLIVVSQLAFSLLRGSRCVVSSAIAVVFVWWKGPLSDPFIDFANTLSAYQIGRVVDYSDLVALLVLPIALRASEKNERQANSQGIRPLVLWPLLALTTFAITGTSLLPLAREFTIRPKDSSTVLADTAIDEAAAPVLERHGCDISAPRRCETRKFSVEYVASASEVSFVVRGTVPLFGSNGYIRDADKLVAELKEAFAEKVPGLEFVENLDARFCRERETTGCSGR